MKKRYLKKLTACIAIPLLVNACAPFVPDNYLSPNTIKLPQKIHGRWVEPRLIPISAQMLKTPEGRELLEPALTPQPYRVGPFDNLTVIVWGHPEVSTVATSSTSLPTGGTFSSLNLNSSNGNPALIVQTDGTIFFPYVGHVKVDGLTLTEIQDKITVRLSKYIRSPQVTVQVSKFRNRNIYVLGEVKGGGVQPLTDKPLTLLEAISAAGGINTSTADPTHIYLVRGTYKCVQIFVLNAQSPQSLLIAERFPLQENDILYVSAATLNSWNNFIGQVLPNFSTYYTIKGLS